MATTSGRFVLAAAAATVAVVAAGASARPLAWGMVTFIAGRLPAQFHSVCAGSSSAPRRVVAVEGSFVGHAWGPRGQRVALVARNEKTWALDVSSADGKQRRRLATARDTGGAVPYGQPAWSPNGELIAFVGDRSLFVVRPNGRGLRRLLEDRGGMGWYADPSWSADGDRIFVVRVRIGPVYVRLVSIRPDGTGVRTERSAHEHRAYGAYSPDRTKLAWREGLTEIRVASADGSGVRSVAASVPWPPAGDPVWSPDGSEIAYLRDGPGVTTDVFAADAETGRERRVTTNGLIERDVAWHPGRPSTYGRCAA